MEMRKYLNRDNSYEMQLVFVNCGVVLLKKKHNFNKEIIFFGNKDVLYIYVTAKVRKPIMYSIHS